MKNQNARAAEENAGIGALAQALASEVPSLFTVPQFSAKNRAITEGQLRWLIFQRDENGLEASGAIVRFGRRRILIDEKKFFSWLIAGQAARRSQPAHPAARAA